MDDKIEPLLSKLKQTAIIGSLSAMTLSKPQNVESKEHKQQNPFEQTISQDANNSIIVSQDANSNSQAPSIDRKQIIEQLSTEDAKKYTDTQRKYLNDDIKKIMDYDNRRINDETLPMSYYAPEFYAWVKETTSHLNTRVDERAQEQRIAQNTNVQQNSRNQVLANEGRS